MGSDKGDKVCVYETNDEIQRETIRMDFEVSLGKTIGNKREKYLTVTQTMTSHYLSITALIKTSCFI